MGYQRRRSRKKGSAKELLQRKAEKEGIDGAGKITVREGKAGKAGKENEEEGEGH